jgi:predicted PurR-regulated permease PerM
VAGVSLVITSIEGMLLAPVILGRAAHVNTVSAFVALMFWGWLWGAVGLVVAVPVLMIVKTVADHVDSLSAVSTLLAAGKPAREVPRGRSAGAGTSQAVGATTQPPGGR